MRIFLVKSVVITFHHDGVSQAIRWCFAGWGPAHIGHRTWVRNLVTSLTTEAHGGRLIGTRRLLSPVLALVGAPRTLQRAHTHVVSLKHQVIDRPHHCEEVCVKC